tara:strand:+ start:6576 stop:7496 length:921 start_codon:yes stop_codon:yes gene_type:complete
MNVDFSNYKVMVIGDLMIDNYIFGKSSRISPEAPVPVIIPETENTVLGGAGNVVNNLSNLGAQVSCMGVVGNDIWGEKLISLLKAKSVNTNCIEVLNNYPTTVKKRIYSNGVQVARLDTEKIIDWSPSKVFLDMDFEKFDVIILSDYNKGVLNSPWYKSKFSKNVVIVDPKKDDFNFYQGANIITPNLKELEKVSKTKINNKAIFHNCNELISKHNIDYIVVKKGDKGMTIVGKNNFLKNIKAHNVKSPDVTGAGDTVISTLSLFFAKTKNIIKSAEIANFAASIVVSKSGTASIKKEDIKGFTNE